MRTAGLVLAVALGGCASWSWRDTALEVATVTAIAVDTTQTIHACGMTNVRCENNPVLGPHPSAGSLISYNLIAAAMHVVIAHALPAGWRTAWQGSIIGLEGWTIYRNTQALGTYGEALTDLPQATR